MSCPYTGDEDEFLTEEDHMFCPYCGTEYEVPKGYVPAVERTCDMPITNPAVVTIWPRLNAAERPDFSMEPLHSCTRSTLHPKVRKQK